MEKITLQVGSVVTVSSGATQDNRREVEFVGEELASRSEFGMHRGNITDTRGVTETLYRVEPGRLIVHVRDWSQWQGEPNIYTLHEVTEVDLHIGGRFEALGHAAGDGRPLDLDEALTPKE